MILNFREGGLFRPLSYFRSLCFWVNMGPQTLYYSLAVHVDHQTHLMLRGCGLVTDSV